MYKVECISGLTDDPFQVSRATASRYHRRVLSGITDDRFQVARTDQKCISSFRSASLMGFPSKNC